MASTGWTPAPLSASSHTSTKPQRFGELVGSTSSHGSSGLDDYKILQPGDFTRTKGEPNLRSRPASRIDWVVDSDSSNLIASSPGVPNLLHDASPLPPDFDLVTSSCPIHLTHNVTGDRATFGPWKDDVEPVHDDNADPSWADAKEDLVSVADEGSDTDSAVRTVDAPLDSSRSHTATAPLSGRQDASQATKQDSHLTQLKLEAEAAWANYRPGLAPQQQRPRTTETDSLSIASSVPSAPGRVPQRVASLRRSSLIANPAQLKQDSMPHQISMATSSSSSLSSHGKSTPPALQAKLDPEYVPYATSHFARGSLGSIRAAAYADMHHQRPYTASILSSTSEGSLLSYQNSFESGMSPLLLNRAATSGRLNGLAQRPATAGSMRTSSVTASDFNYSRPLLSATLRCPETSNQLSAEQRRQQVRRTKKLTQMLGEEMLFATSAAGQQSEFVTRSQALGTPAEGRMRKYRHSSMPFNTSTAADSSATFASTAGSKTRALSRKLLHNRTYGGKSWDHAFSDLSQNAVPASVPGLNRKAAALLGIPHPYSSGAQARISAEDIFPSDDELDVVEEICSDPRPFVLSGLEEFNEPTPKVDQLATFSAAALDEAASPTLPQDGPFRAFDRSGIDQALALSESRKLAVARDERRRRVAKMSRWLGEAVPAELISSGNDQTSSAVIVSTNGPNSTSQFPPGFDSPAPTTSDIHSLGHEASSSARHTSSNGHGSVSHEGSVASNLQSFMSIDSSDDECDDEAAPSKAVQRGCGRILEGQGSAVSSPQGRASARVAASDSLSTYRNSIESYEYLLENDHTRLGELASIFQHGRAAPRPSTIDKMGSRSRRVRPMARPQTSPVTGSMLDGRMRGSQSLGHLEHGREERPPRPSAAFLELSDSESDSSEADELYEGDDASSYPNTRRQRAADMHDRSISKLSNFFGSTPSQIVRSQSDMRAATSSGDSVSSLGNSFSVSKVSRAGYGMRSLSQPDALKTMLRSLEEEALDDSKLNPFQKSEISRKVHGLKKRTTKIFG